MSDDYDPVKEEIQTIINEIVDDAQRLQRHVTDAAACGTDYDCQVLERVEADFYGSCEYSDIGKKQTAICKLLDLIEKEKSIAVRQSRTAK
tara:strand:- start:20 stop:292 length:273 start_codon:yes stop_codon:yes gene_type:complete